jgi:hypothetical protein
MKVSELVRELKYLMEAQGDLEVEVISEGPPMTIGHVEVQRSEIPDLSRVILWATPLSPALVCALEVARCVPNAGGFDVRLLPLPGRGVPGWDGIFPEVQTHEAEEPSSGDSWELVLTRTRRTAVIP